MTDLTGHTYGYWLVQGPAAKKGYWRCVCTKCTTQRDVLGSSLTSGKSQSCGCRNRKGAANKRIWDYM